jgi:hypothetical protein
MELGDSPGTTTLVTSLHFAPTWRAKCRRGNSLAGFLVLYRGIEANPEKIKAIEAMRPPARIKDVQKLTGSLAALSRFISRLAERALPFFKLLRKSSPFTWTEEAEQASKS